MPDLLFLAQRVPYPPNKGEKIRAFHELQYFSRRYDIHLGCLIDDPADVSHIEPLRALCRSVYAARIDWYSGTVAGLRGLLTGEAISVSRFRDRGLGAWVRRTLEATNPEVTFVNSSNMARYILDQPRRGRRIVDLVDVDSEKWRALAEAAKGPMCLAYRREYRKIAELERQIAHECDWCTLVSDAEAGVFARQYPAARIRGISNGVDNRYFDPALRTVPPFDTARPNYVFTGTMDYPPNVDAVRWFATEILPLIQRALPQAAFHIVGSNPSPAVVRLARLDGVSVTGRVADVRPYIAHAVASVAPMRIARGIQNKVLEAMSMARPVIATSCALEGIAADPSTETICADTAETFAAACRSMATTTEGEAIGRAARTRIMRDYDWEANLCRFDDILCPERVL